MAKRVAPEINAGSMADIAFLLLIFFLVTTTMDVNMGIERRLPQKQPPNMPPPPKIKKKNLFIIDINAKDEMLVRDKEMDIGDLEAAAKRFIDNNGSGECTYCRGARDPESSDKPEKAVIAMKTNRGTSYKFYLAVQNELGRAYKELRDTYAQSTYGRPYADLNSKNKKKVRKAYPMIISEAKPIENK